MILARSNLLFIFEQNKLAKKSGNCIMWIAILIVEKKFAFWAER